MKNPALQKFYASKHPASSSTQSTNTSLDITNITKTSTVAASLKTQTDKTVTSSRTLSTPVLLARRQGDVPNIAVVFGETDDLRSKVNPISTSLSQTNQKAGFFAEIEATKQYGINETELTDRLVNIDKIDLDQTSAEDVALILEAINTLSENNSFRKTNLPEQVDALLANIYNKYPCAKPAGMSYK